jgi:hypothetical protein
MEALYDLRTTHCSAGATECIRIASRKKTSCICSQDFPELVSRFQSIREVVHHCEGLDTFLPEHGVNVSGFRLSEATGKL